MKQLYQWDDRWGGNQLGTCDTTISAEGCVITSLSMIADKYPDEVNNILRDNGGYVSRCACSWARACELLGLQWNGSGDHDGIFPCIGGVGNEWGSHFIVLVDDQTAYDPVYGVINWKNDYVNGHRLGNFEQYFNIHSKTNQNMTDKQIQEKVWAEPSTLIFAGKHDPTNRFAFLKLTGRWDYPGNKVITLDDLKFNPKTINPELLTKQLTEALKTIATRDQKVAELTGQVNTGNSTIKSLQSQIEAIKGKVDDKDIEIYQLKEQLKNCQTGACPKWYEQLLEAIRGWFK